MDFPFPLIYSQVNSGASNSNTLFRGEIIRGMGASGLHPLCDCFLASFRKGLVKKSIMGLNGRKNVREGEGEKEKEKKHWTKIEKNMRKNGKTNEKITLKSAGVLYYGGGGRGYVY